jgi:hypothetical protein
LAQARSPADKQKGGPFPGRPQDIHARTIILADPARLRHALKQQRPKALRERSV